MASDFNEASQVTVNADTAQASEATTFAADRPVDISIRETVATYSGTIHLQRKLPSESTWQDVDNWVDAFEGQMAVGNPKFEYRLICKSGNYTSGTALAGLYQ